MTAVSRSKEVRLRQRGVVVEHVQAAEARHDRIEDVGHLTLVGHVGTESRGHGARVPDGVGHQLGGRLVDVDHEHSRVLTGHGPGRRAPDPATTTGNDGNLPGETVQAADPMNGASPNAKTPPSPATIQ